MKVKVYILDDALDLFQDEKIEINQKLNDIEKLSNIFTDFTNSFTIPASQNNNRVMKHFYNHNILNGYNLNLRIDGFIEVDTIPFKFGQWQLEECIMKDGIPESYKITFYSKTSQLSTLFGSDTIDQLDYVVTNGVKTKPFSGLSQFDFVFNEANLIDSMNNPAFNGGNMMTPLIAYTDRDWNYGTNNSLDISSSSYPITTLELKQAVKIIRIIESIELKYGITFTRDFFGNAMFNKIFIWMNNTGKLTASKQLISLDTFTENDSSLYYSNVSKDNNTFSFTDNAYLYDPDNKFNISVYLFGLTDRLGAQLTNVEFKYEMFDENGDLFHTETKLVPPSPQNLFFTLPIPQSNVPKNYSFRFIVSSDAEYRFDSSLLIFSNNFGTGPYDTVRISGDDIQYATIENSLPRLKVLDFIQGIMKMFKLIIRPISPTSFYIDTLDNFYFNGNILDITNYVDMNTVTITRPLIYKNLQFLFEKTENVLGKKFRQTYDPVRDLIGYGDYSKEFIDVTESSNLEVKLPFENMLFERMIVSNPNVNADALTNIIIGQSCKLNDDLATLSKNDSKPILFFNNGPVDTTEYPFKYKFDYTTTPQTINSVFNIGNTDNIDITAVTQTINWYTQVDPWHNVRVTKSLYNNYWFNWITTIYSIKQRKFNFKAILPPRYITELSLNDRLIIGDNRYKINDYTIDLVTGEANLNLFNDIY